MTHFKSKLCMVAALAGAAGFSAPAAAAVSPKSRLEYLHATKHVFQVKQVNVRKIFVMGGSQCSDRPKVRDLLRLAFQTDRKVSIWYSVNGATRCITGVRLYRRGF